MPFPNFATLKLYLIERLRPGELQRILLTAALIGVVGALATIGFRLCVAGLEELLLGRSDSLVRAAMALPPWLRMLIPALGGICAGLLLQVAVRNKDSGGDYMEAIAIGDGRIDTRQSLLKAASSAVTVASGSSIGREGSMVQLAAWAGARIGCWRKVSRPKQRLLVACGAAAGITAAYNAPIAGALFVAEIVLRSLAIDSLAPLLVASVMANLTVHQYLGFTPVYQMPALNLQPGAGMLAYATLGLLAGLIAPVFLGFLEVARACFSRVTLPLSTKLGLGGLIVGMISLVQPAIWGNGYSVVNAILQGDWAWQALLVLLLLKVLATGASTGSGAVGGVFTPTLFIGAAIGSLFGSCLLALWPHSILVAAPPTAYVVVGMGAFLAATTRAPLMATLMIFEMTGNYDLIAPLMLACVLGYVLSRLLLARSIYAHSLPNEANAAFATLCAGDIMREQPPTALRDAAIEAIEREFLRRRWPHVYIVDHEGLFCGAVSVHDFSPWLRNQTTSSARLPEELLLANYPRVTPDMSLGRVLEIFAGHSGERLPLVDAHGKLLGFLSKTDLILLLGESMTNL